MSKLKPQTESAHLLQQTQAAWTLLTEGTTLFGLLLDDEGMIVTLNPSLAGMIGSDWVGKSFFELLDTTTASKAQTIFDNLIHKGTSAELIFTINDTKGIAHTLQTMLHAIKCNDKVTLLMGLAHDVSEHHARAHEHQQLVTLLNLVFSHSNIILWTLDKNGLFTMSEGYALYDMGMKPGQAVGQSVFELYKDYPAILENTRQALNGRNVTYVVTVANRTYHTHMQPLRNPDGEINGVIGVASDITDMQNTLSQMQILTSALEQTADLVLITRTDGSIEYVNPSFCAITGFAREELLGKKPGLLASGRHDNRFYKRLWDTILGGDAFTEVFINKRKDGSIFYEEKTITPIRDHKGTITHFIATGKDISERMRTQERLQFMAHHDALTKLPNRTLFADRLRQAMARARWHQRLVAIVMLDIDQFGAVNKKLGERSANQILLQLSRRLSSSVRTGDTVARLGNDEFAVLLEDLASEKDVSALAKKLLDTVTAPFVVEDTEFTITASIGVSIFPTDAEDPDILLRDADIALYRAKDMGQNNYQFFSQEIGARAFERLALENSLRQALMRQEFFLLYQPQYDIQTQRILGVEALLRWRHPSLGVVTPNDFIPLLEETGLIAPVGEWVLREACQQARRWEAAGIKDLIMSVNLSGRQFNNPDFVINIQNIIADTGICPQQLELELTESMLMRNASRTISALNTLNHIGVRIAIDDFGTGYSSLNYLRRFRITTLKIDRSFIRDAAEDADDAAITSAIIGMGKSLHLHVVAEGVENADQLQFLKEHGCHRVQGNFLCHAANAEEISKLLLEQQTVLS